MQFPHPIRAIKAGYAELLMVINCLDNKLTAIAQKQNAALELLHEITSELHTSTEMDAQQRLHFERSVAAQGTQHADALAAIEGVKNHFGAELTNIRNRMTEANHLAKLAHDSAIGDRVLGAREVPARN